MVRTPLYHYSEHRGAKTLHAIGKSREKFSVLFVHVFLFVRHVSELQTLC